jgi:hypothetical protein
MAFRLQKKYESAIEPVSSPIPSVHSYTNLKQDDRRYVDDFGVEMEMDSAISASICSGSNAGGTNIDKEQLPLLAASPPSRGQLPPSKTLPPRPEATPFYATISRPPTTPDSESRDIPMPLPDISLRTGPRPMVSFANMGKSASRSTSPQGQLPAPPTPVLPGLMHVPQDPQMQLPQHNNASPQGPHNVPVI